jgi:hypothetical protein
MPKLTPVAEVVHALTFDQRTQAYEHGGRASRNRAEMLEIATACAHTLGSNPTYEQWTEYATQWKDGWIHDNPQHTAEASDTAWTRFAKTLDELFGLTKPKSTSASAEKKASERAEKTAKLLEKHADTPAHTLQDQIASNYEKIAKAIAQGKPAKEKREDGQMVDLKKEVKELETVIKAKTSEENKAHGEELKRLRAEVREKASKCTDVEKLETVLEILDDDTELSYVTE